jgi:undecaprenyl-diphosphatase
MEALQVVVLALIQGLTEFLPISSSAHLVLVPAFAGWPDQGLVFDIAVHLGTLLAIGLYFHRELCRLFKDWCGTLIGRAGTKHSRLAWQLCVASLPLALVGFLAKDWVESSLRSPIVIAWASIGFGLLLWLADRLSFRLKRTALDQANEYQLTVGSVLAIAIAQIFALIPGTSRSGVTLSAGLALGLSRQGAARFSFYLSIPVIIGAALLGFKDLYAQGFKEIAWPYFLWGMAIAGLSGLACIHLFLGWVQKAGLGIFVVYRLCLGVFLLYYFS